MTRVMERLTGENLTSKNVDALAALAIFSSVFLTYSAVIFNTFGVLDDWFFLSNAITGQAGTVPLLIGAGRPLNAFIYEIGFSAAGSIEGLSILRLITIIGISFLGFFLYKFSRAQHIDFATSLLIAIGTVLLPSFHVYASWAQHFTTPYAGILAIFSAFILTPGCRIRDRSRALAIALSAAALITSLLIYQPIAMLFWTGILISLIADLESNNKWNFVRLLDALIAFSIAMIVAFIIFKIGQAQYPTNSSRYGLVNDIPEKLTWFISDPLKNAISLYAAPRNSAVQWLVLTTALTAFLFLAKFRGLKFTAKLASAVTLVLFLSYIPNLATAENWGTYRSIGALAVSFYASLLLVIRFPIRHILQNGISRKYGGSAVMVPLCFLVGTFVVLSSLTQFNVSRGFVLPNVTELNNLASFLKEQNLTSPPGQSILVKTSSWKDSSASVLLYDEFGMHSSLQDYYSLLMVKTVLRSMGLGPDTKVLPYSDKTSTEEGLGNNKVVIV